jgi:hypothetical protein
MLASEIEPGFHEDETASKEEPVGRGSWEVARYACVDNFVEEDARGWSGRWSDHRAVRVSFERVR